MFWMEVAGVQFIIGAALLVIITPIAEGVPGATTATGWAMIGYLAAVGTFLPFALFYWVLRRVTSTQASLVAYVVPLIAVVSGVLIRDELLTSGIVLGGLLILAGVVVTDRLELISARAGSPPVGAQSAEPSPPSDSPSTAVPPPPIETVPARRLRRRR